MKPKKRIKQLEGVVKELQGKVETKEVILVDQCNPECRVTLSLNGGEFLIVKHTTTSDTQKEVILKDNK